MNTFAVLALIVVAMSGALARPHAPHRSHRQTECDDNYRPFTPNDIICGSDGKTYVNIKQLEFENCLNEEDVTVEREGWCEEDVETIEGLKNVVWVLVSSFFEDLFKDADLSDIEQLVNAAVALSSEETNGEEVLNFVKELDSAENTSDGVDDFLKFLEGLADSNENNEAPPVEEEEVDLESNLIPEVLLD